MKKVFKASIILSLLGASAFSIIVQEPARAGKNRIMQTYRNCKLVEMGGDPRNGYEPGSNDVKFKVKHTKTGELFWSSTSWSGGSWGKAHMRRNNKCWL